MPAHRAITRPRPDACATPRTASRRRFLGYLLAAPTLVVAAELGGSSLFGTTPASGTQPGRPRT